MPSYDMGSSLKCAGGVCFKQTYWSMELIMDKKKLVGVAVAVVLAAVAYLWGPDMVQAVKDSVGTAPVSSEAGE